MILVLTSSMFVLVLVLIVQVPKDGVCVNVVVPTNYNYSHTEFIKIGDLVISKNSPLLPLLKNVSRFSEEVVGVEGVKKNETTTTMRLRDGGKNIFVNHQNNVAAAAPNTAIRNETFPWANLSDDLDTWVAPIEIRQNYPYYLSGYDEEGRPIWIGELGRWNFRKVVEAGAEAIKIFDKYFEQAAYRCVKSLGDRSTPDAPVKDAIMIADFDEFNIIQTAHVPTVAHVLTLTRKYRQVIAKHLFVGLGINTNAIATSFVNLIRPTFGSIFERAEIYGTNKARWIPRLLKYCPRNALPEWYGGTKNFQPVKIYG